MKECFTSVIALPVSELAKTYLPSPLSQRPYEIREKLTGIHENNGAWYVIEHVIVNTKSGQEFSLGRTDWADWCHSGDLLYAKGGRLWRLGFDRRNLRPLEQAETLEAMSSTQKKSPRALNSGAATFTFRKGASHNLLIAITRDSIALTGALPGRPRIEVSPSFATDQPNLQL